MNKDIKIYIYIYYINKKKINRNIIFVYIFYITYHIYPQDIYRNAINNLLNIEAYIIYIDLYISVC